MNDVEVEPEVRRQLLGLALLPRGSPHSKQAPAGCTAVALAAAAAAAGSCTPAAVPITGSAAAAAAGDGPLHALNLEDAR